MKIGEDRDEFKNISVDNESKEDSDLITEEKIDEVIDEDTEMYSFGWSLSLIHISEPTRH